MLTSTEQFFYDHAGFNYNPTKESAEQGRRKCASELAAAYAELYAVTTDAYVSWEIDPEITSHDWESDSEPERPTLCATLHFEGKIVGSLGGIDVKDCNSGDPYCKVVEAELWQEFVAVRTAQTTIQEGDQ